VVNILCLFKFDTPCADTRCGLFTGTARSWFDGTVGGEGDVSLLMVNLVGLLLPRCGRLKMRHFQVYLCS
jgi:hypothetical protein